jgi:hypothetical protein
MARVARHISLRMTALRETYGKDLHKQLSRSFEGCGSIDHLT